MDSAEILRIIDAIHRDKNIDKELLFQSVEFALATAARKRYDAGEELMVHVDRETGDVEAYIGDQVAEFVDLGRIGAQTAKQIMIQRIREAEQDVVLTRYNEMVGEITTGVVQRVEGGNLIVSLGKGEGILPRSETVRSENYSVGDRIKALITEVKKVGLRVRIILSRTHPDLVRRLFEIEVPEIADDVIEIKRVAREPGYRTKIAVASSDMRVDCIGACVGIRGTRIKSITEELGGEKIDIIRWNDSVEVLIMNALRPAEISNIELHEDSSTARVFVTDDQLSLAIGRRGQNVRLASKLTGWEIDLQPLEGERESPSHPAPDEAAGTEQPVAEGTESATPADAEATPADAEATPADAEATPADAEATPADAEATPADAEATPADAEATPADAEATPADAEATPADAEAAPEVIELEGAAAEADEAAPASETATDAGVVDEAHAAEAAAAETEVPAPEADEVPSDESPEQDEAPEQRPAESLPEESQENPAITTEPAMSEVPSPVPSKEGVSPTRPEEAP